MKKTKNLLINLAAGLLVVASVGATATSISPVHAAATTQQSPNSEQGTLKLNHKTRIYNKWGQKVYSYRGGRGLFKYGSTVKYRGKVKAITDPRTKRYAFRDDDWNWFYLPYRTIRGQEYYNIGHGGYVKAANVSKVDGCYLYTNEVTFRANAKYPILRAVNGKPKSTGKAINKGQTVTLNGRTSEYPLYGYYEDGDGDSSDFLIKGSNKEYISLDNDTFRQILLPYSNFMQVLVTQDSYMYTEKGEKFIRHVLPNEIILGNNPNKRADYAPQDKKGEVLQVYKALYMWAGDDQRVELFYQLDDYQYGVNKVAIFIKAANTKYVYGPQLKPVNAEQDVKK